MLAHLEAPRPSPVELCPDLPREFDDVVRRAMAIDPNERYPSAGDLGQAALVAAGGLRRAESVVRRRHRRGSSRDGHAGAGAATVAAARAGAARLAPRAPVPEPAKSGGGNVLRWAIALAALAIVAVGMVAALMGISTL